MKKTSTKQWLRAFALMALMLATSMAASAADRYYLRGGVTDDDPGWSSNNYQLRPCQGSTDKFYRDFTVSSGFQFKLVYVADGTEEEVWIGSNNGGDAHVANEVPYTFTEVKQNEGDNMIIGVDGTYRFTYDKTNETLAVTYVPCPIVLYDSGNFNGGTITADKSEAAQGDIVTLTVTPDYGYACNKDSITIEYIINAGEAHAPQRAPQLGETFHPVGDAQATHDNPATYTFVMPEYPYGVWITAKFQELGKHKIFNQIEGTQYEKHCTITTDQPDNDAVPAGTVVTVTVDVTPAEDLYCGGLYVDNAVTLEDIEFTDNGDGTYTFVMPDENVSINAYIAAYLHGVTFDQDNRWATYFGKYKLACPSRTSVYVVTGVEGDEVLVKYTQGQVIPANTGVLLYSETEEPRSNLSTRYFDDENNVEETSLLWGVADEDVAMMGYVLYEDKFILSMRGVLSAHRCFLPWNIVNGSGAAGAPRTLKIKLPDEGGVITGVDKINAADVVSVKYVSLTGVVSDKPFDGVNIAVETLSDGTTRTVKVVK
ncbi:MAG: hypothetical protein IJ724_03085 [Muribaculaceae bacterium]|nr:hypothetical protein [Muribaculaceae bacterium]